MNKKLVLMLLGMVMTLTAMAQSAITGTVVSAEDGEPIIGATVKVKGQAKGVVTDMSGKFSLNVKAGEILEFSYVGMTSKDVKAKNGMMVSLVGDDKVLDEVMVVAYGTAKKSSLTGSVEKVDAKAIEKNIGTSVTSALEGNAPGVQVNNTYGEPGAEPTIRIRGFGSVNGSNSPLYVLDGAIYTGNISDINPNDVESMTVLKDASAAALYGNRAANGVIIITTKHAKQANKPQVTLDINQGWYSRGIKEYARLGANQWMEAEWKNLKNAMISGNGYTEAQASAYATQNLIGDLVLNNIYDKPDNQLFDSNGNLTASILPGYTDLDWEDAIEQVGHRQEYNASFATSGDKFDVYAGIGYLKEKGYIINTGFERYSGRVNTNFTPTKWFKGGVSLAATQQEQNYNSSAYSSYYANPFYAIRYEAPVYPIYSHGANGLINLDENGDLQYDLDSDWRSNRHIIYERKHDYEQNKRTTVELGAYATFNLPYDFSITIRGNKNLRNTDYSQYENPNIGDGASDNGRLAQYDYHWDTTTFQQQLNWGHNYGLHHVDALLAHESYEYKYKVTQGMNTNMSVSGNYTMGNFSTNSYLQGYEDTDATESYLARARYNYDEKYYFETSFRRDGSSRFSEDSRWGNFWSIGGAWDFSKEKFLKNVKWLDFGKFRISYGEVGNNQGISYYAYQALYDVTKNGGSGALVKASLAANDLKWETTQTFDIGVDARFFNRLNFSVGYFNKKSKDLLFAVNLPGSAGSYIFGDDYNLTQLQNLGDVSNRGWEIAADYDVIKTRDWKWNVGADVTFLTNEIITLPNHDEIANGTKRFAEGRSMYEFYTYHFEGVDQMTGNSLYTIDPDKVATASSAGKLVTINGVNYTTDTTYGKKDWAGSAIPTAYGSFHTDLTWKDLTLSVLLTYSLGGKVYDSSYQSLMSTGGSSVSALHEDILKSWNGVPAGMTEDSPNRIDPEGVPVIDNNLSSYNNATSDRWLTSASYLVAKNITLSYNLPKKWIMPLSLTGVTVKFGIENAFTITSRQGLNPQYSFSGSQDATYTTARIINLGLKVKF